MNMKSAPLVLLLSLVSAAPVLAGPPTALVEDVTSASAGVEPFGYLQPGQVIHLGAHDSLVLSYLNSCTRERIQGGIVTIGRDQSEVQSGIVERNSVACDTGRMQLTAEIASQGAGAVFRSIRPDQTSHSGRKRADQA
jgi:hypothetical protein